MNKFPLALLEKTFANLPDLLPDSGELLLNYTIFQWFRFNAKMTFKLKIDSVWKKLGNAIYNSSYRIFSPIFPIQYSHTFSGCSFNAMDVSSKLPFVKFMRRTQKYASFIFVMRTILISYTWLHHHLFSHFLTVTFVCYYSTRFQFLRTRSICIFNVAGWQNIVCPCKWLFSWFVHNLTITKWQESNHSHWYLLGNYHYYDKTIILYFKWLTLKYSNFLRWRIWILRS